MENFEGKNTPTSEDCGLPQSALHLGTSVNGIRYTKSLILLSLDDKVRFASSRAWLRLVVKMKRYEITNFTNDD